MTDAAACDCIMDRFFGSLNTDLQNRFLDELPEEPENSQPWRDLIVLATTECLQEPMTS